jgi:hypothetical protein
MASSIATEVALIMLLLIGQENKALWPTKDTINEWRKLK